MANARPIGLRRVARSAAATLAVLALASTEGCSCSNDDTAGTGAPSGASSGAGGGSGEITIAPAAHAPFEHDSAAGRVDDLAIRRSPNIGLKHGPQHDHNA